MTGIGPAKYNIKKDINGNNDIGSKDNNNSSYKPKHTSADRF